MSLPTDRQIFHGLTASNAAAAAGMNPHMSRQKLWRVMTGREEPFTGNQFTQWGHDHEIDAISAYEAHTGIFLEKTGDEQEFVKHPVIEWLGCTPDGRNPLVQAKCPQSQYEEPRDYHLPQLLVEMACTDSEFEDYVVWTPEEARIWRVYRDPVAWQHLMERMSDFWALVCEDKEPPRGKREKLPPLKVERLK